MLTGGEIYFAKPDALQGSLLETLKWARPTYFFAVPRVWEKIEIRLREIVDMHGNMMKSVFAWAQNHGKEKVRVMQEGGSTGLGFEMANSLIIKKAKKFLGLDQCKVMMYGSAPLKQSTVDFFAGFDMPILNIYGLSEVCGTTTVQFPSQFKLETAGMCIAGSHFRIGNPDQDGNGEVQIKGRSIMMGYLKNGDATRKVISPDGYLSSGDIGKITDSWLVITGRIKELIITSGGENVAPVAIEDIFKAQCSACSNIMLLGEN